MPIDDFLTDKAARFEARDQAHRNAVLGGGPRSAIAAASRFGGARHVDREDERIDRAGLGASGPAAQLYDHFGITQASLVSPALHVARGRSNTGDRHDRCP